MAQYTKRSIIAALNASMGMDKNLSTLMSRCDGKVKSLASQLTGAYKTSAGREVIKDVLFVYADDMDAKPGNPFHKLRLTLGNRCKP